MACPRRRRCFPERPGDGRKHHVVHRAAERVLDRLDVPQARAHPGEAAMRADRRVVRAARRGVEAGPRHRADPDRRLTGTVEHPARPAKQRAPRSARPRRERSSAPRAPRQLRAARERPRKPALARRGGHRGLRRCVEEHRHDVDAGDAVHEGVVGLGQQREALLRAPSTSHSSQSGLSRSSCCANTRPARSFSWRSEPGEGGRSSERGSEGSGGDRRPTSGGPARTGRMPAAGGSAGRGRAAARSTRSARHRGEGGPSKSITEATCMCAEASSRCRKDASWALSRSPATAIPPSARFSHSLFARFSANSHRSAVHGAASSA